MTTAAGSTFEPARGGRGKGEGNLSQLSKQYSSRNLPYHIKYRQTSQDAPKRFPTVTSGESEESESESCSKGKK